MPSGARVGWKVSVLSFGGWPATVPATDCFSSFESFWISLNQFESLDILDAFRIFRSESTRMFQDVPGPRFTRSSKGREHSVNFLQLKVVRINWGDLRLTDFWYFLLQDVARCCKVAFLHSYWSCLRDADGSAWGERVDWNLATRQHLLDPFGVSF